MKIVADNHMPLAAKLSLEQMGEVLFLEKQVFLYDSIASHPDIFFCQIKNQLVAANNIPKHWENWFLKQGVQYVKGKMELGEKYPDTACYNAVATSELFLHNLKNTDQSILELTGDLIKIHVNQAYTRCNLIPLNEEGFITSDRGIEKQLLKIGKRVLFIQPGQIHLSGQTHGFIGGCCGIFEEVLYVCGSVKFLQESKEFKQFTDNFSIKIVELYDGPLTDIGSILFIK
jgi:hypothetical protein